MKNVYVLMMVFTDGEYAEPRVFMTKAAANEYAHELMKADIYEPFIYDTYEIFETPLM